MKCPQCSGDHTLSQCPRWRLVRRVREDEIIPALYGVAWQDWRARTVVVMPIPVNVVAGLLRSAWIFLRWGWRAVPACPRDAYAQGRRDALKEKA